MFKAPGPHDPLAPSKSSSPSFVSGLHSMSGSIRPACALPLKTLGVDAKPHEIRQQEWGKAWNDNLDNC